MTPRQSSRSSGCPTLPNTISDPTVSKKYSLAKRGVFFFELVLSVAILAGLQFSPAAAWLKKTAIGFTGEGLWAVPIYMILYFQFIYLLQLPSHYYSSFVLEKKYELSKQSFGEWLLDEVKKYALSLPFFIGTMWVFYSLLATFPAHWWILAGFGWLFLTVILARILPTVLLPIFYPSKPLPEGPLRSRLEALCARLKVKVKGIYEIGLSKKTKKANAAVIGIGKSRRIILGDTLTAGFEDEEIEMVMAHEIGHHALRHVPKGLLFNTLVSFGGFYILYLLSGPLAAFFGASGIDDLLLFPAVTLMGTLGGIAILPVQNGFSRFVEYEADRYAIRAIPNLLVFKSMMVKLGEKNLAEPDPDPWVEFFLYTHPSIPNRIRRAESILTR